jgi:CheY-like chemotaxis protein
VKFCGSCGVYSDHPPADNTKVAHHLLLADDSVTIQRVIKLTFADEDVDVVTVGDGNQAVAAIEKEPPDIVLADIAMPGRSGYEVAQHIRATPRLAHIPVVLLTGAFEPVDEARASEVGCDGVLAKPFEPEMVVSRVRELLSRPRPVASETSVAAAAGDGLLAVPPAGPRPADIDAYFDRLDQAFAARAASPRPLPPPAPEPIDPAFDKFKEIFVTPAAPPAPPIVRSEAPAPFPSPAASSAPVSPPIAASTAAAVQEPAMPSLADAFEGLLADTTPVFAVPPTPPDVAARAESATPAPPVAQPAALADDYINQIADRVVERITARLAGGQLSDIVSRVAERLVREEIDDIKRRL